MIYIGSPYSHPEKAVMEENFRRVSHLAAKLCAEGKVAFSPITYGHTLLGFHEMPHTWEFWQNFCLSFLVKSDTLLVYKMPGWEKSKGLEAEISFAHDHGIQIEYLEYEERPIVDAITAHQLVQSCETAEDLSAAIVKLSMGGQIEGSSRSFDANKMASYVSGVIAGTLPANALTRNYGIRQQALYIKHCEQLEKNS